VQELNAVMDQPAPFWLDLTDLSDEMADWRVGLMGAGLMGKA
jgi:hypothetical protein